MKTKKKAVKQPAASRWTGSTWGIRTAWRLWRKRRAWQESHTRILEQFRQLDSLEPWCVYSRLERITLRELVANLLHDLDRAQSDAATAFAAVEPLRGRIERLEKRVSELLDLNGIWAEQHRQIQAELNALRQRASLIPGRNFAQRTDALAAPLKQHPDQVFASPAVRAKGWNKNRKAPTPSEYFPTLNRRIGDLRTHVETAETAIRGLSELNTRIGNIGELGAQSDVAAAQEYERLLATREAIEHELANGQYQGAFHHLQGARRLCSQLQNALESRFALARSEIDLWLDDEQICQLFNLGSFPKRLTATDTQRWQEMRVEISAMITARSEASRKAYAVTFGRWRKVQFKLEEFNDWECLEAFARAAMNASSR